MNIDRKIMTYLNVILNAKTLEEAKREARLAIQLIEADGQK